MVCQADTWSANIKRQATWSRSGVWPFGELDRLTGTVSLSRGGDEAFDSQIGGASQFSASDRLGKCRVRTRLLYLTTP